MNLAELQHYFARAATSSSGALPDLDRVFVSGPGLSAEARLAIYNRCYFYRLLDALSSVFAQTKRLLGEHEFERLGLDYVAQNPSLHPAVERVGRAFPEYLRGSAANTLAADLAALEWARLCALVAPNPSRVESARSIDPQRFPRAHLSFVPSLRWLELEPQALTEFEASEPATALVATTPSEPRCGVAVWRSGHAVQHRRLDATEWQALLLTASGAALSRVCEVFDSGLAEADVQRAFQVFSHWFARNWLERVDYDDDRPTSG